MTSIQAIEAQRDAILDEMRTIRALCRGSITEQFLKVPKKESGQATRCGPYYVFSRRQAGKTVSRRLKPGPELEQARQDVAEHRRFVALCQKFEELTEQLGQLERTGATDAISVEKKRLSSPSSKTGK